MNVAETAQIRESVMEGKVTAATCNSAVSSGLTKYSVGDDVSEVRGE